MGQYYTPVVINLVDGKPVIVKAMLCYDFDNGAKLMEHSWMGNNFVQAFETLLVMDGPVRVVWAGDYADGEEGVTVYMDEETGEHVPAGTPGAEVINGPNLYTMARADDFYRPDVPTLGQTYVYTWTYPDGRRRKEPLVRKTKKDDVFPNAPAPAVLPTMSSHPWLLNHDKGLAVDKRKVPKVSYYWSAKKQAIHPLPLLTVEGNGRGGGDFHVGSPYGDRSPSRGNFDLIGSWARDRISLSRTKPKGFETISFDLVEMGVDETPEDKAANNGIRRFA